MKSDLFVLITCRVTAPHPHPHPSNNTTACLRLTLPQVVGKALAENIPLAVQSVFRRMPGSIGSPEGEEPYRRVVVEGHTLTRSLTGHIHTRTHTHTHTRTTHACDCANAAHVHTIPSHVARGRPPLERYFNFGACASEVEVDVRTGEVGGWSSSLSAPLSLSVTVACCLSLCLTLSLTHSLSLGVEAAEAHLPTKS
jgi:hypothetical protein